MAHAYKRSNLYIGIMSGTSLDAVDVALVEIKKNKIKLLKTQTHEIPETLRDAVLKLCTPGDNAIQRMGETDVQLGRLFADAVKTLLSIASLEPHDIAAIGTHGQTIRHVPNCEHPFTVQIGDPNIIAALTGITTIGDFRRRDMALGGQGAPLAPAFHQFLLQEMPGTHCVLNIGGIANISVINGDADVIGFDTGPGNTLLDSWCFKKRKLRFDHHGDWANGGNVDDRVLALMLSDPYFQLPAPKSTGREYFNLAWIEKFQRILSQDMQATLTELTTNTIVQAILKLDTPPTHIWACGGGVKNRYLMNRLQGVCPVNILSTDVLGVPADWVEACAFAWLAYQTAHRQPSNITSVTGASKATILGAVYPA